jgi:MarR family transcriptional regulator, lower aerobic nicotinate degradation pathway regulator
MTPATHRRRDRVLWLAGRVALHSQRLLQDHLAGGGLRKAHYAILASLVDVGPATQARLADRLGIDRSDMVSLLDDLEAQRYLVRKPDPTDRRRKIVEVTARGETVLKKLDKLVFAADDELLAPLDADERATLAALLARLLPPDDRRPRS